MRITLLALAALAAISAGQDSLPWRGRIVFDQWVRVDDAPGPSGHPAVHPQTFMDEDWDLYSVWADDRDNNGQFEVFFAASRDTGRSWSVPNRNLSQGPSLYYLFPWLAVDRSGLYVAWQAWRGNTWRLFLTRSFDRGATWTTPTEVPGITVVNNLNSGINFGPQAKLAVDSRSSPDTTFVYLLWADNATGKIQIKLARSADLGASFSDLGIVDKNPDNVNRNPYLAVDDSGWVHCAWARGTSGSNQDPHCWIGYNRSRDRGNTFLAGDIIVNDNTSEVYRGNPSVTCDQLKNKVLVSWEDSRRAGGNANPDIWFSRAHRESLLFAANQRVNWWRPDTGIRCDNFKPVIRMDPAGVMVAAWHDDPEKDASYGIHLAAYTDTLGRFTDSRSLVQTFTGTTGANFGNSFYPPSLFVRALISPAAVETTTHFFIVWQDFREDTLGGNIYSVHGRVITRPPWPYGWHEVRPPVPAAPSGKPVKDGGWLAMNENSGLISVAKGNKTSDFYSYDPLDSTASAWRVLAPWPDGVEGKKPAKGSGGVSDHSGHVYAVKGANTLGFWRYHSDGDSWSQLPDVPLGPSDKKVKGGTDLAYVVRNDTGYVYLLKGYKTDFFRFNTVTRTWDISLQPAPTGTRAAWGKGSWLAGDGERTLYAHKAKYHELWSYDAATDTWRTSPLAPMPLTGMLGKSKKAKDGSSGAFAGGHIYALKGGNTCEFWRFDAGTGTWFEKETMPSFGSTGKKKRVKAGGDIAYYGDWWAFFALKGNKTLELWRYVDSTPPAQALSGLSGAFAGSQDLPAPCFRVVPSLASRGFARVFLNSPIPVSAAFLSLYDITGRRVLPRIELHSSPFLLDLRALSAGVYFVRLETPDLRATRKLTIK